jgi:hypothetical protein
LLFFTVQVLGKDGYNPSGLMASISKDDEKAERAERAAAAASPGSTASGSSASGKSLPAAAGATGAAAVDTAIASICKYKVGGDGGKCLALLDLFLKNVVEKPTEDKYRSINTESNAFKSKVAGLAGGIGLLKAVRECVCSVLDFFYGDVFLSPLSFLAQLPLVNCVNIFQYFS